MSSARGASQHSHGGSQYRSYATHLPPPAVGMQARVKQEHDGIGGSLAGVKGGASEFVKKLYKMLEDSVHFSIVSWGAKGDSFLVKDMNEFTKTVLPLHFKHSNFASFVRQLNKYDFHKIKASEGGEGIYGDHTWEFKHPNFRADTKKSLEFIKRKGPAPRKPATTSAGSAGTATPAAVVVPPSTTDGGSITQLQQQFAMLQQIQQSMGAHMSSMSTDLHNIYAELVKFQNTFVAQDQLIQNIIQYLVRRENTAGQSESSPSAEAQQLLSSYAEIAHTSAEQLAELTRRASVAGGRYSPPFLGRPDSQPESTPSSTYEQDEQSPHPVAGTYATRGQFGQPIYHQRLAAAADAGSAQNSPLESSPATGDGMFSNHSPQMSHGPLSPKSQAPVSAGITSVAASAGANETSTWKHTPRVLVVEDDVVCRRLSSRFLEVFGCIIDTAVDGVEAVKKMNSQPYDLVFMDISMPNLDGVSATSIIRQFNSSTPIISMTSNSEPNDILTYFSHGMTDVLPKPFTKEALFGMLEKHLVHLTQIKQLVEVPRALGFPEQQIQHALASTLAPSYLQSEAMFGQEPLNPFAEMGITDEDFTSVLLSTLTNNANAPSQGHQDALNPPLSANGKRVSVDDAEGDTTKRLRYEA